ncbi:MAG: MBL fold metallo-hydrolase [Holophagales bacterium]|jgi:glyoxylase-like metal-dependent hydrolase (beta-lactamase superfamily II)|nr:MBL fold metallo-hydrolase [Holophagales bacterium]
MLSLILSALISMQTVQTAAPQHRVEKVRDNIYCVFGPGGNVGLIVDNDYVVLIDGQYERSLPALLEAVKTISDKPIKYLINTHHHGDHVDANRALASQVEGIIAHTNVRSRMIKDQLNRTPDRQGGLPDILVGEADTKKLGMVTIVVGPTDVHIAHFGPAHTDADAAVGIPSARVIHMGDMLFLGRLPFIDVESGGNFDGLAQVIGSMLSWLPDDSLVIPGHGPICDKKELARHHSFLLAVQQHVRKNPKMSPKELADSFDKKPWEDKEPSPQFVTWETLFQAASGQGSGRVKS